jgi:flagellar biosynthesis/type III secretory pathway protein FliH
LILFGDDFDVATTPRPHAVDRLAEAETAAGDARDAAQAACAAAYAKGLTDGAAGAAEERRAQGDRWAAICAERLEAAGREAADLADTAARDLAGLLCSALAAVLPEFCARHGAAEIAALARSLLPSLIAEPRIVLRLNPRDAGAVAQAMGEIPPELEGRVQIERVESVAPGDMLMSWADGRVVRDAAAMRRCVSDLFRQFGLVSEDA